MWYFYSLLPDCSSSLVKANCFWPARHIDLNVVSCILQHSPIGFLVFTAARGWDIHGATTEKMETRGHCALEGRRGISRLRYLPGDDCSGPQVMNGSFLSGKPRSHPEGANWVRTRSISRSSRALTTAKSWWRTTRCNSSLQSQRQGKASHCLCLL